jgi:hypothetical protein
MDLCEGNNTENGRCENASAVSFEGGLLGSKTARGFAGWVNNYNVASMALSGLLFASVLRPITIMSLPGQNKNKEDKFYAATHSFSSGVVGFIISTIVTNPLGDAVRTAVKHTRNQQLYDTITKITSDLKSQSIDDVLKGIDGDLKSKSFNDFIKGIKGNPLTEPLSDIIKEFKDDFDKKTFGKIVKNIQNNPDTRKYAFKIFKGTKPAVQEKMLTLMKQIPDLGLAVPRAMLTIALIPYIQKYVFGATKKQKPVQADNKQFMNNFIDKPVFQQLHEKGAA